VSARLATVAAALVLGGAATSCVVQKPPPSAMCFDIEDCDSGEICGEDHVCYCNPPPGTFAAVITPPAERADLSTAEVDITFDAATYGDFAAELPDLVHVSGRVVLADSPAESVKAKLVFRRASRIPGAADVVVTVSSLPGMPAGTPSYEAVLSPTEPGERWRVTIFPDDGKIDGSEVSPAELAPPYRQDGFVFDGDATGLDFPLGGNGPQGGKTIAGRVLDAAGQPIAGLRVLAFGRFGPLDGAEIASSRGTTGREGRCSTVVPVPGGDDFDVTLSPRAEMALPEITVRGVHIDAPAMPVPGGLVLDVGAIQYPVLPPPSDFEIIVDGRAPGGGTEPVVGARVVARTTILNEGPLLITYREDAFLDGNGKARLTLVPGVGPMPRAYAIDVIPPSSAPQATVLDTVVMVGPGGPEAQVNLPEPLPSRVLLSGTLHDATGLPQGDVTVRIEPSAEWMAELAQGALPVPASELQWPRAITDGSGHFGLWVDPELVEIVARYRVFFEPGDGSLLPRMVIDDLIVAPDNTSNGQDLGDQWLPDAAFVRGVVKSPSDEAVAGAVLQVFEIVTPNMCAAEPCPPRSILRAQARSGEGGAVRLVLPRP